MTRFFTESAIGPAGRLRSPSPPPLGGIRLCECRNAKFFTSGSTRHVCGPPAPVWRHSSSLVHRGSSSPGTPGAWYGTPNAPVRSRSSSTIAPGALSPIPLAADTTDAVRSSAAAPQDFHQVADAQFAGLNETQDSKADRVGKGPKHQIHVGFCRGRAYSLKRITPEPRGGVNDVRVNRRLTRDRQQDYGCQ